MRRVAAPCLELRSESCRHLGMPEALPLTLGKLHEPRVGVLGPTRMDYSNNMAAVRATARYLTRLLAVDDRHVTDRHDDEHEEP